MFVEDSYTDSIIANIFSDGKINSDEPIFEYFNKFLNQIGLDVAFTTFHLKPKREDQSENRSDNGNDIGIHLKTSANFFNKGFDGNNNWNGNYKHTEQIKKKWKELAKQYNFPEHYYDFVAHIFVYDFEKSYLYKLLYQIKPKLLNEIGNDKWKVKPTYIFCSSFPAYNIIYGGFLEYYFAAFKGDFSKNRRVAELLILDNDKLNMYTTGSVKINFYHTKMKNINLYGLSRED